MANRSRSCVSASRQINSVPIRICGRRAAIGSVALVLGSHGCPAVLPATGGVAHAGELATATFASGKFAFMEYEFLQLKYAGVSDVVPGYLGPDKIEAVQRPSERESSLPLPRDSPLSQNRLHAWRQGTTEVFGQMPHR
eukprot:1044678-Pyramimonas_sp.AAC.2